MRACGATWRGAGWVPQVSEAMLKAFGVELCGDLIAKRGLLAALFSEVSTDFFLEAVRLLAPLLGPHALHAAPKAAIPQPVELSCVRGDAAEGAHNAEGKRSASTSARSVPTSIHCVCKHCMWARYSCRIGCHRNSLLQRQHQCSSCPEGGAAARAHGWGGNYRAQHLPAQGLGLGRTQHAEAVAEGAVGRKGMSVERTFTAISSWADLEAKAGSKLTKASSLHPSIKPCCTGGRSR